MRSGYIPALVLALSFSGAMAKKTVPAPPPPPTLEQQMLAHVEKILVIDTIDVDREDFFRSYRLMPSAGRILSSKEVASALKGVKFPENFTGSPSSGFTNEFNDYLIWAQKDTTGYLRLAESYRLLDGTWSSPEFTSPVLNGLSEDAEDEPVEANAAFPFMADDGQTLYFASDSEASLGGYDIFVASKDPSDGSFLLPGNLGMPFNSEFDDYMMVLDNQSGVGWWASDRNQLGDKVTVYIYALSDERVNVDPDDENLLVYASLSGWESLLDDEAVEQARQFREELSKIKKPEERAPEFILPVPGGKTYRYISDFKNRKAASQMQLYLAQKSSLEKSERELSALREEFAKSRRNNGLDGRIKVLEEKIRSDRNNLKSLLSDIYKLEFNK